MKSGNFKEREVSTGKCFLGQAHMSIAFLFLCSVVLFVPLVLDVCYVLSSATASAAPPPAGTVWTWGYNGYGQSGDGTTTDRPTPVQVVGVDSVVAIADGHVHTIALKSDGTVWTWGDNSRGQLGDGTTTGRLTPVQVTGLSDAVDIAAGTYHTIGLKSDGSVWTWGENYYGQLGDGTYTTRFAPVQVVGVDSVVAIAGGGSHTVALKSDETVWTWGSNFRGELGNGAYGGSSPWPRQVAGVGNVAAIAAGDSHTIALVTDSVFAITITSGAGFTSSPSVTLTLMCPNPGADCLSMQFSNDNSVWSTPEAFSTSKEWTLTSGDGLKTVYVSFQDAAGNWTGAFSDTIILDTIPPTTTASPASGFYSGAINVTLTCNDGAGSGCGKIYYALSGLTPTTSSSVYSGPLSISSNATLSYFAVDRAGNSEAVRTEVYTINGTLPPTTPPSSSPTGSVQINDNVAFTNSASVTLTLNAQRAGAICPMVYPIMCGVTEMMLSNDGLPWTGLEPAATSKQWTLTSGDGIKTVYARFKDTAGNWSVAFGDTIVLDTTAPATTASLSGGLYNGGLSVTLTCADGSGSGCNKIYYTVDGSTPSTSSPVYTAPITISLNTTLNFFARDLAGNQEPVKTQVYTIDNEPPTGSVVVNSGADTTNSVSVVLTLSCVDSVSGCAEMQFSSDNTNWTTPEAYATTKAWVLLSGDGTKTVFARFKDNAGNWSTTVGDSILLSTAKPDLRISSLIVPETGTAGRSITVTDTTWNAGPGTATASTTRFYLSKDPSLSARDVLLGSRSVQPLSAGGSATGATALTIPRATEEGNYYILAVSDTDNAVSEVNESNNVRYRSIRIRD
jgi:hypothetical protein